LEHTGSTCHQAGLQDAYAGILRFITKKTLEKAKFRRVSDESGFSGNSAAVVF
jgi:hypothetical protein